MLGKKAVVIICALIAVCAGMYLVLPSPQDTGEPPKTAKTRVAKQQVKKSVKASPRRSIERQAPEDNITAASPPPAIPAEAAPPKAPEPINKDVEKRIEEFKTTGKDSSPQVPKQEPQVFEKRMDEFKNKYEWDDPATTNLAEFSIEMIPEAYRDSGMTAIMKNLDAAQSQEGSGAVDERKLLEAIEKTMPEGIRPSFRKNVEKYKEEHPR